MSNLCVHDPSRHRRLTNLCVHDPSRHWRLTNAPVTSTSIEVLWGDPQLQTLQKTALPSIPELCRTNSFLICGDGGCPFMGNRLGPVYVPHMKATLPSLVAA